MAAARTAPTLGSSSAAVTRKAVRANWTKPVATEASRASSLASIIDSIMLPTVQSIMMVPIAGRYAVTRGSRVSDSAREGTAKSTAAASPLAASRKSRICAATAPFLSFSRGRK